MTPGARSPEQKLTLEKLLELTKKLPPMTPFQRAAQSLDFAYGNLACSTNHRPTQASREEFKKIATRGFGWSEEQFETWAKDREWL